MATPAPVDWLAEIDSTNAEARRRAEAGERGPAWIAALRQSAGRGRRGRVWDTGEGNLAATLLFQTDKAPGEAAQLSFVAALAVADLAHAFVPPSLVSLKWPNDPLIFGRKASGILIESGQHPMGGLWVAVGVGVNLAHAPKLADRPTTSFADHMSQPPPTPQAALEILARAFAHWEGVWRREGFAPIARAWTSRAHGLGEPAVARLPDETVQGIAEGLDIDGALRLRQADGTIRRITAGDVYFGGA
ncbi:MAG: biotin--acetyl-CoA-carboxylase ligase [Caulobacter sp.]|nr:biotin--acetyl-CoA-carboxylase ligase [Caulobacter sp.]